MNRTGVLITAFGGPRTLDEIGPFIAAMTGREPSAEVLERSRAKYARIGGGSPLPEIAERIARALAAELGERGASVPVRVGMRYAEPSIEAAVDDLVRQGVGTVVTATLSPLESKITTRAYRQAVGAVAEAHGCAVLEAPPYTLHPGLVQAHADALHDALARLDAARPLVIMTAHSLPCEEIEEDDTYVVQLRELAGEVARAAGLDSGEELALFAGQAPSYGSSDGRVPWTVAYQSRGYRECRWLEPGLEGMFEAAVAAGHDGVVCAPVGFVTDHMETRYDLDVVAREAAEASGLAFERSAVPNDDPRMIRALADTIVSVLPGQEGAS